jgi:hypothetical protein
MLRKSFPLIVGVSLACVSGSYCLAQPTSSSSSTETTQPDNPPRMMQPLAFKLHLDPADMTKMTTMMHAGHNACVIEDLDPGDDSSMIAICGIEPATESFQP